MKYLVGAIIGLAVGLAVGIILNILWKKKFAEFLPDEDAFVLKLIIGASFCIIFSISGILIGLLNKYCIVVALILIVIALLESFITGIYYKTIATKKSKF